MTGILGSGFASADELPHSKEVIDPNRPRPRPLILGTMTRIGGVPCHCFAVRLLFFSFSWPLLPPRAAFGWPWVLLNLQNRSAHRPLKSCNRQSPFRTLALVRERRFAVVDRVAAALRRKKWLWSSPKRGRRCRQSRPFAVTWARRWAWAVMRS